MALHGEFKVNGMTLGSWEAQRVSHTDVEPQADDRVTYKALVQGVSDLQGRPAPYWRGEVVHRFGDGYVGLACLVLASAVAADPTSSLGARIEQGD